MNYERRTFAVAIEKLEYTYPSQPLKALRGISLTVQAGEFVGIIGENGAGKTTLLKNIMGLLAPTRGQVLVEGLDPQQTAVAELARRVGFVLQNPDQQLFAQTVEEEIAFGPRNLGLGAIEINRRVDQAIAATGLEAFRAEFPPALAKGDRAKVVIASVLAMQPSILIFDEPTTGQDCKGCHQIMSIARQMHQAGRTVLVVTHNMALIAEYAQRLIVLAQGKILLDDTTAAVFSQPEVLRRTQIIPPQITRLSQSLPAELNLPDCALTVEQLGQAILKQSKAHDRNSLRRSK